MQAVPLTVEEQGRLCSPEFPGTIKAKSLSVGTLALNMNLIAMTQALELGKNSHDLHKLQIGLSCYTCSCCHLERGDH